ncbi:MAG: alpha-galactosidase, partial [Spirochaetes bacterium]|nr:alpha-galactosidase [Spirochaetota bacterium]
GLARERFLAMAGGRYNAGVKNEHADTAQICLADPEARQWVLSQLVRFIDQVRPDHLKWDNNYWINCDRTGHGHGTQDGNFAHVRGLYTLLAALRARYPNMTIENCSGGGNRLDLGMLQYTDVGWMDDVSGPSAHVRHNLQGLGTVFPSRYLLSFVMDDPAEPIHRAADMPLYFRSRMAGALGMSLIGAEFAEDDLADMSREIALYKRLRDAGPEPVLALLTDQVSETSNGSWDAVQLSALDTGSSYMLAFRGDGADVHTRIRPVNLWPDVFYRVSASRGQGRGRIDGATLMEDGVEVGGSPYTAGHVVIFTPVGW